MLKSVLVVDDSKFMRSYIKKILSENGYNIVGEATNGAEAIEKYKELNPSVITMDIVMEGVDGVEASTQILKINPNANIVIISSIGQKSVIIKLIELGIKDFVLKPIKIDALLETMERLI